MTRNLSLEREMLDPMYANEMMEWKLSLLTEFRPKLPSPRLHYIFHWFSFKRGMPYPLALLSQNRPFLKTDLVSQLQGEKLQFLQLESSAK